VAAAAFKPLDIFPVGFEGSAESSPQLFGGLRIVQTFDPTFNYGTLFLFIASPQRGDFLYEFFFLFASDYFFLYVQQLTRRDLGGRLERSRLAISITRSHRFDHQYVLSVIAPALIVQVLIFRSIDGPHHDRFKIRLFRVVVTDGVFDLLIASVAERRFVLQHIPDFVRDFVDLRDEISVYLIHRRLIALFRSYRKIIKLFRAHVIPPLLFFSPYIEAGGDGFWDTF